MARTKQTARKSSGGKAPRKVLASKSARSFREEMTSRQASGWHPQAKKISYINCDNMFNSYKFAVDPAHLKKSDGTNKDFALQFSTAVTYSVPAPGGIKVPVAGPCDNSNEERWLSMQVMSKLDGAEIQKLRPKVNLGVCLDVSGSMNCNFENDQEEQKVYKSKIGVALECIQALVDQLKKDDSFGLVTFHSSATVVAPMRSFNPQAPAYHDRQALKADINALEANGMTSLSSGMIETSKLYADLPECKENTTNRIYFLTDLASTVDSMNDELLLLEQVRNNSERGVYTTVVGFGVDLNATLITQLSSIVGCKYCSIDSSDEFKRMLGEDFIYEITMAATDIHIDFKSDEWDIDIKGYGSPEVNEIENNKIVLSSEFASDRNSSWEGSGGIYIMKLVPSKIKTRSGKTQPRDSTMVINYTYRDLSGIKHSETVNVTLKREPHFQTPAIRKAIAIVRYVDIHNSYIDYDEKEKVNFFEAFTTFKKYFEEEMIAVGDYTLLTSNLADLQIIDKIIELEKDHSNTNPPATPTTNNKRQAPSKKQAPPKKAQAKTSGRKTKRRRA